MQGIIKIFGEVTDVTYQGDSCINIALKYRNVYEKSFDEETYRLVENLERDKSKSMEIPYCGAVSLTKDVEEKLGLSREEINVYGYGAKIGEIHKGNRIVVYALWHRVDNFGQASCVTDKVIVVNHAPKLEQLGNLVERVVSETHP